MSGKDGSDGRWLVKQQVRRHDDGGEHVVEVVRDAAGELADRLHLLALRHLAFERLLLGRLDGVDDRRLLGALAAGAVGHRVDVEADVALLVAGQHRVDRRDVGLALPGLLERRGEGGTVALVDHRVEPHAAVDRVAVDDRGEQRQERRVGAHDAALLVDAGNRHRRRVEEAREADLGGAQIGGGILALGAVEHDGAGRPAGSPSRLADTRCMKRTGSTSPVDRRQVEVDDGVAGGAGIGLDRADQRHAVAGDDFLQASWRPA